MADPTREDDLRALHVIDLRTKGQLTTQLRKDMALTNSSIQGMMKRYRDSDLPCLCEKPENQNGGMPDRWWEQ
ncbi:hypothetical protein [Phaeobacter sp. 22II1-1F12B]|uniref:hypothetical protein n=1 Tax=Phaeobacter sp. 22II1-1F12B TaxID=1317111 RepID=UPI000B51F43F|nr:hypothetical protein [Phaeobacter sp. 22II1-1F12B]OWU80445.1 hypothetical protein ATO1_08850 [Phaeobacter sp. 22II1-1F12B]